MSSPLRRRRLLAIVAATAPGFAGCLSGNDETGSSERETATPATEYASPPTPESDAPDPEPAIEFEYDCPAESPDPPSVPDVDDAIPPLSYPDPPSSADHEAILEYVTRHEEAYRRNDFVDYYGEGAVGFGFDPTGGRVVDVVDLGVDGGDTADRVGVLAALVYDIASAIRHDDGSESVGDEWDTRVTYYVDQQVVLRAKYDVSSDDPVVAPDPRREGSPLECFDQSSRE